MTTVAMGQREMALGGKYLTELRDANELLGDAGALRGRLADDGYLLIRRLHDPGAVASARALILDHLAGKGLLAAGQPRDLAVAAPGATGSLLARNRELVASRAFLDVVEGPAVMDFFRRLLDGAVLTFSYKWLRCVGPGRNTGAHYDIVYMGRGTRNLFTCWTPIGEVPLELGPLAVLPGSHRLEELKRTYGASDVDRDKSEGWYSTDPIAVADRFGLRWATTEFAAGDAIVFGMFTMHGSLNNATGRFRLSCDTRYQRADEPADPRWVGDQPAGHDADSPAALSPAPDP